MYYSGRSVSPAESLSTKNSQLREVVPPRVLAPPLGPPVPRLAQGAGRGRHEAPADHAPAVALRAGLVLLALRAEPAAAAPVVPVSYFLGGRRELTEPRGASRVDRASAGVEE